MIESFFLQKEKIIIYIYDFEKKFEKNFSEISKLKKEKNKIFVKFFLEKPNIEINKIIQKLKKDVCLFIGKGTNNKTNKFLIEKAEIDILQNPEERINYIKKENVYNFDSGLNVELLQILKKRKILVFFDLNFFKKSIKIYEKRIGKISQNVKLLRKYKIGFFFIFEKNKIENILPLFELSTNEIKNNEKVLFERIEKENKKFINEFIKIK